MCNEEEESHTYLFLHWPFAKARWHGSTLAVHTSDYTSISIQHWLKQLLSRHNLSDSDSMYYLQDIFTILWTIWTYRNRVVHQGITPNLVEVVLIAQNLSCRYKDTLSNYSTLGDRDDRCTGPENQSTTGDWQLGSKLVGARSRRPYRNVTAYEALTVQGDKVFFGAVSSNARTSTGHCWRLWLKRDWKQKIKGLFGEWVQIHILNNITHISTHFFTHTYFKNLQTIFKLLYQTSPKVFSMFCF